MRKLDEEKLLKRCLGDNETYPGAVNTGIAIGDGLLKAQAWLSAMWHRAGELIAALPMALRQSQRWLRGHR
jgi:hypothetical protein